MPNLTSIPLPSQSELKHLFSYDSVNGKLIWNERPESDFQTLKGQRIFNKLYAGRAAGCVARDGYFKVRVNYTLFLIHRLIWGWHCGSIDAEVQIDHINGNRSDNRIENLRVVTAQQNSKNCKLSRNNTSGIKGVSWYKRGKKWRAQVCVNYKAIHLGFFDTVEEASLAASSFYKSNGFTNHHIGHFRQSL